MDCEENIVEPCVLCENKVWCSAYQRLKIVKHAWRANRVEIDHSFVSVYAANNDKTCLTIKIECSNFKGKEK